MEMKKVLLAALVSLSGTFVQAQDDGLKYHLDFKDVSGTTVDDAAGSGVKAKLMNQAKVEAMGIYNVLNLGSGAGYLDLTSAAGALLKAQDNYAISVYYRVNEDASLSGAGFFLWAFSTSMSCTADAGKYVAYRLNAQRFAATPGGYSNEVGIEVGSASQQGKWKNVVYSQEGGKGSLYIDGRLVGSVNNVPLNSTNFGTGNISYCWIGRAPFSSDQYLTKTLVADFRIYGRSLTEDDIKMLVEKTEDLDYQYEHGNPGDNTKLKAAIESAETLLATAEGDYPAGAIINLEDVITFAKGIAGQTDISQTVLDRYTTTVNTAITAFKAKKGKVFDDSNIVTSYDINRGFKHPGGLHTQEDFDRVKKMLADGNSKITEAYEKLKTSEWAQTGTATWPVETIVRGGGSGENYLNAARGAAIAYENALRWKIEGNPAFARHAVDVLMAWCNVCKLVSGDSNWALAAGLYGYEFAQAAELVRDYEGWSREDFNRFKEWMLRVWYAGNINFLRSRNGTWENYVGNQGGYRPGHYWSNWPLCNALACISIGVLCDDVFIYNQGMSFMKYDQAKTFVDPRTADPILNDGCTEFIGNLVVTTKESALETGAYGKLGQMQESGRDGGHAAMALGLAVDIAHMAWNQGDDLFSYMDNRLAAGIEFVAACSQNVQGLPWTNYKYVDCRTAWHNGWLMTGPAEPCETRPYWGTVIGHYEGVKGVKMPFSERAYNAMGIDGAPSGGTSGPYDHLNFSVLMNHRDHFATEEERPTLLTPAMRYKGTVIAHNELGGIDNTFVVNNNTGVQPGGSILLMPQLPEGATDTEQWEWNTGETTKNISVPTNKSFAYRVTYTNENGVKSEQVFTIASQGDCTPDQGYGNIYVNSEYVGALEGEVFYGSNVTLNVWSSGGWGSVMWETGETTFSITIPALVRDRQVSAILYNQGGQKTKVTFNIKVKSIQPVMEVNGTAFIDKSSVVVNAGDEVVVYPEIASSLANGSYEWSDGSTGRKLNLGKVEQSGVYTLHYKLGENIDETLRFYVYVNDENTNAMVDEGNYLIRFRDADTYLTNNGDGTVSFNPLDETDNAQKWFVTHTVQPKYDLISLADSTWLSNNGVLIQRTFHTLRLTPAKNSSYCILHSTAGYWTVDADGIIDFDGADELYDYPFELIPVEYDPTGIHSMIGRADNRDPNAIYNVQGQLVRRRATSLEGLAPGVYIMGGKKIMIR